MTTPADFRTFITAADRAGLQVGPARLAGTYAFRSLIDAGATAPFGSDWPVAPLDSMVGIHAAVTREPIDGRNPTGWLPRQKVTVELALTAYTVANGFAGFQDGLVGQIAPGRLADITVLDRDIRAIPADDIRKVRAIRTIVGGKQRYVA